MGLKIEVHVIMTDKSADAEVAYVILSGPLSVTRPTRTAPPLKTDPLDGRLLSYALLHTCHVGIVMTDAKPLWACDLRLNANVRRFLRTSKIFDLPKISPR
jgi:hypothetical protein